jgi:hypothetical protein
MKKLFWAIVALVSAFASLLPGVSEAGRNLNHNNTLLRGTIFALAVGLASLLPGISEAGKNLNHNQTRLVL